MTEEQLKECNIINDEILKKQSDIDDIDYILKHDFIRVKITPISSCRTQRSYFIPHYCHKKVREWMTDQRQILIHEQNILIEKFSSL